MKRITLLFIFIFQLFFSFAQQKYKAVCDRCDGTKIKEIRESIDCQNCQSWAESYRNAVGCNVCKNYEFIIVKKKQKCDRCNGTGYTYDVFGCIINHHYKNSMIGLRYTTLSEPRCESVWWANNKKSYNYCYYSDFTFKVYEKNYEGTLLYTGKWECGKDGKSYTLFWDNGPVEIFK